MNRLRDRLILIFLAATLAPLGATCVATHSLFRAQPEYYASTEELDQVSKSLGKRAAKCISARERC